MPFGMALKLPTKVTSFFCMSFNGRGVFGPSISSVGRLRLVGRGRLDLWSFYVHVDHLG